MRREDRATGKLLWGAFAALVTALAAAPQAWGLYLDDERRFSVRLRAYSLYAMATENSQTGVTDPPKFSGQMMSQRNFIYPEFDGDVTSFLPDNWLDELSARLAIWAFYDGLYDYGPKQYGERAAEIKFHTNAEGVPFPNGGFQTKAQSNESAFAGRARRRDVRAIYAHRWRFNEAYVNLKKGPLFLRIGRQAISWGEADTIGLLDANNPFDTTIAPGLFVDLDEARIPLWTVRATYQLFQNWGPFSSTFLDTYLVPGSVDVTVSPLQMQSGSPYSAPPPASPLPIEVAAIRPAYKFGNSRWGVRLQSVIAQEFTTSIWFYKTFPVEPPPLQLGVSPYTGRLVTAVQQNRLINVAGIASSFFSEPLSAVIRSEVEVFNNFPGFRVNTNLFPKNEFPSDTNRAYFDKINVVRGEIGMDRNFFVRAINPSNSFIWVTSFVWTWYPDETKYKDYRATGLLKPSALKRQAAGGDPAGSVTAGCDGGEGGCDFVNQPVFDWFAQTHIQTDFLHGRLTPGITTIVTGGPAAVWIPEVNYRITDSFLFNARYLIFHTFGSENTGFSGPGVFRDRDQIWFKLTYQLN